MDDGFRAGWAVRATAALVVLLAMAPRWSRAEPPPPPGVNEPGAAYPHGSVKRGEFGAGARSYWLYEPAQPAPERAPVVVFNHGWLAVNPGVYGAWIHHLVRSGHVVVFPRYQTDALTPPQDFVGNAVAAVLDALDVLETAPGHVRPDRARFALIGHSAGGNLAAQMAAVASERHLPEPRAVIALMPGEVRPSREPSLSRIPATTLLVVAAAEDDLVVGDVRARQIFTQAEAVPTSRKKFVLYRSDLHGTPRLVAHHFAPTAVDHTFDNGDGALRGVQVSLAEFNALDRAGFWRLTDATLQAAFAGKTLDEAIERGADLGRLGFWSDGRPVEPALVGDDLAKFPRVLPTNGVRLIQWLPDRLPFSLPTGATRPAATAAPGSVRRLAESERPTLRK